MEDEEVRNVLSAPRIEICIILNEGEDRIYDVDMIVHTPNEEDGDGITLAEGVSLHDAVVKLRSVYEVVIEAFGATHGQH